MSANKDQEAAVYSKILARAWREPAFKARLLADPAGVLKEAGVSLPAGVEVAIVESTATKMYLVLPPKPAMDLSDEQLDEIAGGRHKTCKSHPPPI